MRIWTQKIEGIRMSLLEIDSKVQEINTPKLAVKDNVIRGFS